MAETQVVDLHLQLPKGLESNVLSNSKDVLESKGLPNKTMGSGAGRRPTRPIDDSEEENSDGLTTQMSPGYGVTSVESTTTKTTATTTAKVPNPKALDAHLQDVHQLHAALTTHDLGVNSNRSLLETKTKPSLFVSTSGSAPQDSADDSSLTSSPPDTPSSTDSPNTLTTTTTTTTTVTQKKKRRVRHPIFEARPSALDPETLDKTENTFRGFHNLFWIIMGVYAWLVFDAEWTKVGSAFGGTLFSSFSKDAVALTISDIVLVSATFFSVILVKLLGWGLIRYNVTGMVIQHILQTSYLLSAIAWVMYKYGNKPLQWPWVQSGFFTLHSITMLMKIHSYIAFNGEASEKLIQLRECEARYAEIKRNDTITTDDNKKNLQGENEGIIHHHTNEEGIYHEVGQLRHRLSSTQDADAKPSAIDVSMLASEIDEMKADLRTSSGQLWPANVTFYNFTDYLLIPTLIYEFQYPRTSKIRPKYVIEKAVATFGTFSLLYLTTEHYIYPVVLDPSVTPLMALKKLLIPFMMNYLFIFYIIFECICNAFAELTRFADRNFYDDWWNSTNLDEWARKWNKPVHNFLLRHVYFSSIESFNLSKSNAALATFFLSSCVHELVMMVVTGKVRMYLFFLQMCQIPIIWLGRRKIIRDNPRLANVLFWLGMFSGPPLLGVAYCYA
ncbi:hypothetical protein BGZ76_001172 [Entomortierella beljakovae]|nr:hypothetical protein BGZ76_001172 [Entomortierella beljakovae]